MVSRVSRMDEKTYFLLLKEAPFPSRSSRSLGNNLQCVYGYRNHHNNRVCPGWALNIHQFDQDSSHSVLLHSMDHEGLNSLHLHLLLPMTVVEQPLSSSIAHSTFCNQENIITNKYIFLILCILTTSLTWGKSGRPNSNPKSDFLTLWKWSHYSDHLHALPRSGSKGFTTNQITS
jgi:hypothetical protein